MAFLSISLILGGILFLLSAVEDTSLLKELQKWTHVGG